MVYTHPTYTKKDSGLYKIAVDDTGHVSSAAAVTKSDITALGIPASDTTYTAATQSNSGLMSAADKAKLDGITASADAVSVAQSLTSGTKVGTITVNGTATDLYAPANTDTTYSTGTTTTSGLTKLYTGTGSNADGAMTQAATTNALNSLISKGTTDPSASTTSQFYFKYTTD
jgi:hypothetical protein